MIKYKSFAKEYVLNVREGEPSFHKAKITSPDDCYNYIKQFYHDDIEIYESFFVAFLNRANNVIGWIKVGQGGINGTVVDPRLVAKYAIESLCSGVILAHNHPAQSTNPSDDDIKITKKIKEGLKLFDINVLDHIILTNETYYSFSNEGLL